MPSGKQWISTSATGVILTGYWSDGLQKVDTMEELEKILRRISVQKNTSESTATSANDKGPQTPSCPICQDHRWVSFDVSVDDPRFGKSFPCTCALEALARDHIDRLARYSNLGPLTRLCFDNLQPHGLEPEPVAGDTLSGQAFKSRRSRAGRSAYCKTRFGPGGA